MKRSFIPTKIRVLEEFFDRRLSQNELPTSFPAVLGFFYNPTGKLFLDGLMIVAAVAIIRDLKHHNKPVKILGVTYVGDGKMRVDIENRGGTPLFVKPSVRVARTPTRDELRNVKGIPMLTASSGVNARIYDLVDEAADAVQLKPSETAYMLIDAPADFRSAGKSLSVSVEYGREAGNLKEFLVRDFTVKNRKNHPYLRHVGKKRAFILKKDHSVILGEVYLLEGLLEAVEQAPPESIAFHLRDGNDFASWVRDVVGDARLSELLSEITPGDIEEARARISDILHRRIIDLEKEDFTGRHPNLNHVGEAYSFKLKLDHNQIIGEAAFLAELRDLTRSAPADAVVYHLKNGKNDFADWVEGVLGDRALAAALRTIELISPTQTREDLAKIIDYRIRQLSSPKPLATPA